MEGWLADEVALVNGAGAGIGRAVARRMAQQGALVWLNDVRPDALDAVLADLDPDRSGGLAGDMSHSADVAAWVQAAVERFGRIDVLSHNVGVAVPGLIGDLTDEQWQTNQRLCLDSTFYATRAVLGPMVDGGGGSIVAMASGAAIGGHHGLGGYAAAKAGVISLMETVAQEYGRVGVRANAVTPGPTATAPLLAHLEAQPGGVDAHTADLDLARLSTPDEVANTVAWLASDLASNITGICVRSNIRASSRRPPP